MLMGKVMNIMKKRRMFLKRQISNKITHMKKEIIFCIFSIMIVLIVSGCTRSNSKTPIVISRTNATDEILKISNETASSIGLQTKLIERKRVNFKIKYNGIVKAMPNKSFFISSPVNGRVLKVLVDPNQAVAKEEELAEISSQDVAQLQFDITKEQIGLEGDIEQAKLELGLAKSNFERESKLFEDGITAKKDFLEAENKYKRAQNGLEILEKKKKSINELAEKRLAILGSHISNASISTGLVEIKSPTDGIILKRSINPGEVVEGDKILFEVSDLREVFLESQIYEKDLPEISLGKKVTFVTEASPGDVFHGELSYIAQTVNPDTRTVAVRAKIQNPSHKLKPEMFGKIFISLQDKEALVVNKESVQKVDNSDVVYVKAGEGFKEVKVKLGEHTDGLVEVLDGLRPGQEVVTEGSFWLKSELHTD